MIKLLYLLATATISVIVTLPIINNIENNENQTTKDVVTQKFNLLIDNQKFKGEDGQLVVGEQDYTKEFSNFIAKTRDIIQSSKSKNINLVSIETKFRKLDAFGEYPLSIDRLENFFTAEEWNIEKVAVIIENQGLGNYTYVISVQGSADGIKINEDLYGYHPLQSLTDFQIFSGYNITFEIKYESNPIAENATTVYKTSSGEIKNFDSSILEIIVPQEAIEIIEIGWFTNDYGLRQIPNFANNITKVPKQLPTEIQSLSGAFKNNAVFNDENIINWDTSNIVDMSEMFLSAGKFNQNINKWNTINVVTMEKMFQFARSFNYSLNDWNTSSVTNMSYMFLGSWFNSDIGDWDVSKVKLTMGMFNYADAFNQDIGDWNVSSVTNMSSMFKSASSFNQDIGKWDVSNVVDMYGMFESATSFDQDISSWNVDNVKSYKWFDFGSNINWTADEKPNF